MHQGVHLEKRKKKTEKREKQWEREKEGKNDGERAQSTSSGVNWRFLNIVYNFSPARKLLYYFPMHWKILRRAMSLACFRAFDVWCRGNFRLRVEIPFIHATMGSNSRLHSKNTALAKTATDSSNRGNLRVKSSVIAATVENLVGDLNLNTTSPRRKIV